MKHGLLLGAALTMAGCAHVDTGQADYRVADGPTTITTTALGAIDDNRCSKSQDEDCDPILPSRIVRRFMPDNAAGWDAFKTSDVYSIEIEQGMIGNNILEGKLLGKQFGRTAEIAVLANVFEFAGQQSDAAARRFLEAGEYESGTDDPSDVELKLVYFGDDVRRGQALNFSNIPLRARSIYAGGSIGIQLVVMEVDAQASPVASLLKTLARFGQQALPGPGEAKDILFDLGESLLSGSQDDKLMEYRFVLSAGGVDARAVQATFAPGRYVIRRMQKRTDPMDWASLRLDHNTGRLFRKPAASLSSSVSTDAAGEQPYTEVRDDLYLVLNVRKYPAGTAPEFYAPRNWPAFREALQVAADKRAAPLDKVTERLTGLLEDSRSTDWRDGLLLRWAAATGKLNIYSARYAADFAKVDMTGCGVNVVELKRRLDAAEREARDAMRLFRAEYQQAIAAERKDAAGKVVGAEFRDGERERVVSSVASYFMPWSVTGLGQDSFSDASKFEAAFIAAASTGDLAGSALAAARSKAADPTTCLALMGQ